ncbi:hypothetical protein TNCV_2487331 [Trichonephila clavipes]|uniref:Uncharacterized protein n=1 Tax=Trichonephila clavipes TaxID=2585209 RepID=A0A8X6VZS6_TRICX|nr:hypothetical protein TNCV_2487331 [Trichonephila clavipes]
MPRCWTRNYEACGQTARVCFGVLCANRTREVKTDFCDLLVRRNEGRVVNTPLVFKRVLFQEKKKKKETRERGAGLGWRKGKSPALDGEGMRGEPWLKRTGRERERKGLSPRLEWKDDERRWR